MATTRNKRLEGRSGISSIDGGHDKGADVPGGKGDVQQRQELDGIWLVGEVAMPPAAVATG
jgi:hypothetical protein